MFYKNSNTKVSINSTDQIYKLDTLINDLVNSNQSPHQAVTIITDIIGLVFGNGQTRGAIHLLTEQSYRSDQFQWIIKMEQLIQKIGPKPKNQIVSRGLFGWGKKKVFNNLITELQKKRVRISIQKTSLPSHLQIKDLEESYPSLDIRLNYEGALLPSLQYYFVILVSKIYQCQAPDIHFSNIESLLKDDFFFSLTRNPLLVLLRTNLEYFQQYPDKMNKLLDIVKMYLIDGLIWKYQHKNSLLFKSTTQKNQNYRFQLKPTAILALYLCLYYRSDYFQNLEIYFQSAIQFYQNITSSNQTLRYLLRLWLFFVGATRNQQTQLISNLYKANSKIGWFHVSRSLQYNLQCQSNRLPNFQSISRGFLSLFRYDNNWTPNLLYLTTMSGFLALVNSNKTVRSNSISQKQNNQRSKQSEDILKKIQAKFQRSKQQIQKREQRQKNENYRIFKQKYQQLQNKNRQIFYNPKIKSFQSSHSQEEIQQRGQMPIRSLKFHHDKIQRDCWDIPLQYNQSYFLFLLFRSLAIFISAIIPGCNKSNPINIRFLARPWVLMLILLIIYILVLLW